MRSQYMIRCFLWIFLLFVVPGGAVLAAEEGASTAPADDDALSAGDNAWMLTSCALVLLMTAPGLALFYGGLVRKKNVLGVMMQCFFLMGLMSVLWALIGYTLAFGGPGGPNSYVGTMEFAAMQNVGPTFDEEATYIDDDGETQKGRPVTPMEGSIPRLTHMLFQGMFFIITPALICGAFAERMKFSTMVVFSVLWGLIVYCPLCHWVWDSGPLSLHKDSWGGGALDFAGGTVVHISSGASALVCALLLGSRLGYGKDPMPPHNLTYTAMGAAMLWVGWFGFNAGSAGAADGLAASAFAATHLSAAAGAIAWPLMEWVTRGKPTLLGACSGAVAGLVCITPAAGHVLPMPAILMGLVGGVGCFFACTSLKSKLGYDDSLDAFGVHGVGGTLGAILTGVFATRNVADSYGDGSAVGLVDGNGSLIVGQIVAVLVTYAFAMFVTFVILKVLDATMGLRVSQEGEVQGLDVSEHGEEGYIFL